MADIGRFRPMAAISDIDVLTELLREIQHQIRVLQSPRPVNISPEWRIDRNSSGLLVAVNSETSNVTTIAVP